MTYHVLIFPQSLKLTAGYEDFSILLQFLQLFLSASATLHIILYAIHSKKITTAAYNILQIVKNKKIFYCFINNKLIFLYFILLLPLEIKKLSLAFSNHTVSCNLKFLFQSFFIAAVSGRRNAMSDSCERFSLALNFIWKTRVQSIKRIQNENCKERQHLIN